MNQNSCGKSQQYVVLRKLMTFGNLNKASSLDAVEVNENLQQQHYLNSYSNVMTVTCCSSKDCTVESRTMLCIKYLNREKKSHPLSICEFLSLPEEYSLLIFFDRSQNVHCLTGTGPSESSPVITVYIFLSAAYLAKCDFPNLVPAITLLQSDSSQRLTSVTSTNPNTSLENRG